MAAQAAGVSLFARCWALLLSCCCPAQQQQQQEEDSKRSAADRCTLIGMLYIQDSCQVESWNVIAPGCAFHDLVSGDLVTCCVSARSCTLYMEDEKENEKRLIRSMLSMKVQGQGPSRTWSSIQKST
jgi:hypothetical protein